jgi:hypothetical protein
MENNFAMLEITRGPGGEISVAFNIMDRAGSMIAQSIKNRGLTGKVLLSL